jgi:hypothetical protein
MSIDPIAPDVTPETDRHWETRRQFRDDLLDLIVERLRAAETEVESGPLEGIRVVTHAQWLDALNPLRWSSLPPVSDHAAEVVTHADVTVWTVCPRCKIAGPILVTIEPELRVDTSGAELHLRAKSKPRTHVCGQLTIPAAVPEVEGQASFALEDIVRDRCGIADSCFLPEGHEGDCEDAPAEEILEEESGPMVGIEVPADGTISEPIESLAKTPEQAAADVTTKRARRLADRVIPADRPVDDDLLPGELTCEGSVHIPNCSCFDGPEFGDA